MSSTLAALTGLLAIGAYASAAVVNDVSPLPSVFSNLTSCGPAVTSCQQTVTNTCCSPTDGVILATQFWDVWTARESAGQFLPAQSWSIHGLWSDACDGSFRQYCDLSRQFDPNPSPNTTTGTPSGTPVPKWTGETIDNVIKRFGRLDLLSYMNGFWIGQNQPNTELWAHEHATCTSTFDKACYSNYRPGQDVIDYFLAVIRAFKQYPSYQILAANGIVPSNTTTYPISSFRDAFLRTIGVVPYIGCTTKNGTVLSELWYYSHVVGTPQVGSFLNLNASSYGSYTNCATNGTGIQYFERSKGSEVSKFNS